MITVFGMIENLNLFNRDKKKKEANTKKKQSNSEIHIHHWQNWYHQLL